MVLIKGIKSVRQNNKRGREKLVDDDKHVPFVMHGGSSFTKEEFQTTIKNGIRKINYYTYMTLAGGRAVKKALDARSINDNIFFHEIPLIGVEAMKEDVKNAIRIFSMEE